MKSVYRAVLPLVLVVGLVLCACVPFSTPIGGTAGEPSTGESRDALTLTDDMGREVALGAVPERVVSLAPSLTEILFAVGAGDQVVGVTSYCDYPEEATTREQVGGFSASTMSVEKIVSLRPDLVFAAGAIHAPVIEALDDVNVSVVAFDPASVDDVYALIEKVGSLTGHSEEAEGVAKAMRERIDAVVARTGAIAPEQKLRVYWQIWDEPLMTAGPTTYVGQLIEMAGGVNIFGDLTESYPQISAEEVVKRDPDVIMGPDTHGDKLTSEAFAQRPGWSGLSAVGSGRIHLIDGNIISREGPRLADALEAVAFALYPELFD